MNVVQAQEHREAPSDLALAQTASRVVPSGVRAIMDLAWSNPDTIHLEVGEPNFPTPDHVVEAAVKALRDGSTLYSPNAGLPELREAIAAKIARTNGYEPSPDQVVVCNGAVQGLFASFRLMLDPGDEILLPDPAWPNFAMIASLVGAEAAFYPVTAEQGFLPEPAAIQERITDRTRAIFINSPSNPLGTVIPRARMTELLALAEHNGLWVISDECYDEIVFDDSMVSAAAIGHQDRVVSIYSFSKTYAMTGWRVGYVVAPPAFVDALTKIQEAIVSCVNTPAQHGAVAALTGPQEVVRTMRDAYGERRDLVAAALDGHGIRFVEPGGAFYLWVNALPPGVPSADFCRELVIRSGVAVAPGSAFGVAGEGAIRISLAASPELLTEGVRRVAAALADVEAHPESRS